jgi:exodeoxyribonuclease V alpha subunit
LDFSEDPFWARDIYKAIPRGKRLLVLIGQKKALGIAVRNDRPQRRYSGLLASLKGER